MLAAYSGWNARPLTSVVFDSDEIELIFQNENVEEWDIKAIYDPPKVMSI